MTKTRRREVLQAALSLIAANTNEANAESQIGMASLHPAGTISQIDLSTVRDSLKTALPQVPSSTPGAYLIPQLPTPSPAPSDLLLQLRNAGNSSAAKYGDLLKALQAKPIAPPKTLTKRWAYHYQNVEPLLNDAIDLLARALSTKAQRNELATRAFRLHLEIEDHLEELKVAEEYASKGYYNHSQLEAEAQAKAEKDYLAAITLARAAFQQFMDSTFTKEQIDKVKGANQAIAFVGPLPGWKTGDPAPTYLGPYSSHQYSGRTWDIADNAAGDIADFNKTIQMANTAYQLATLSANEAYLRETVKASGLKAQWAEIESELRQQHNTHEQWVLNTKLEASKNNGPLDYSHQIDALNESFQRDFYDAYCRLIAAQKGLAEIYGHHLDMPGIASVDFDPRAGFSINYRITIDQDELEEAIRGARSAVEFLAGFGQTEQTYVLPVSVRSLITDSAWANFQANGTAKFVITDTYFPDQIYVRLRGVSIFVSAGGINPGMYSAKLLVPKASSISFSKAADFRALDQSSIPPFDTAE